MAQALSDAPNPAQAPSGGLDLNEIRALILSFNAPASDSFALYYENNNQLKNWFQSNWPKSKPLSRPRLCIFAAHHGTSTQEERTKIEGEFKAILENKTPLSDMAAEINADLKLFELDFATPTNTTAPAMTIEECVRAIAYGMLAIEQGSDALGLTALGAGSDASSAKILAALENSADPLKALMTYGGFEHAALLGAILAAKLANIPTMLEGQAAQTAQAILAKLHTPAVSHILYAPFDGLIGAQLVFAVSALKLISRL